MTAVELHHVFSGRADPGAPVLVLGGSLGSTAEMWNPQLPQLEERFRVLRYDARGHGGSPVPPGPYLIDDLVDDVVALLDRHGISRASMAGLSLGGMTALRLAARHPERVDRLVLLCTSARLGPAQQWLGRAETVRRDGTGSVAAAVVERWFTPSFADNEPRIIAWAQEMVAATPAEGYAACCEAIASMDLRADLPGITAPTLVIAGAMDPATPPEHLGVIADAVPGARLLVIEQAAHLASVEAAATVTAALLTHLDPAGDPVARGMRTRRAVLGDRHVDTSMATTTPLTAPFQDFITRVAWGDVWSRPGLDRRTRSIITLTALTALNHEHELGLHVRAAINNGLTAAEIAEVLLHTGVYAGVPSANRAFAVAQRVLAELDDPAATGRPLPLTPEV